jgi:hypothetical protein
MTKRVSVWFFLALTATGIARQGHATAITDIQIRTPGRSTFSFGVTAISIVPFSATADVQSNAMGEVTARQSVSEQWIVERTSVPYDFEIGFYFLWTQTVDDPTREMSLIRYGVHAYGPAGGDDVIGSLECPGSAGGCGSFADSTRVFVPLDLGVPETVTVSIDFTASAFSPVPEPPALPVLAAGLTILVAARLKRNRGAFEGRSRQWPRAASP